MVQKGSLSYNYNIYLSLKEGGGQLIIHIYNTHTYIEKVEGVVRPDVKLIIVYCEGREGMDGSLGALLQTPKQ